MRFTFSSFTFWATGLIGAAWIGRDTIPVGGHASSSAFFFMPIAGSVLFWGAVLYVLFVASAWRMGPRWTRPWLTPLLASVIFTVVGALFDRTPPEGSVAFAQSIGLNYLPILFWSGLGRVSQRVQLIAPDPEDSYNQAS